MVIRDAAGEDRAWLRKPIADRWGPPVVSTSGEHDPGDLPALIAADQGRRVGALTYHLGADGMEVVTLDSLAENQGVGTALLHEAKNRADQAQLRLWLITTNDNIRAIRFYQRRGMVLVALHRDFVDVVRRSKPNLDARGPDGIEFRHALKLEFESESSPLTA